MHNGILIVVLLGALAGAEPVDNGSPPAAAPDRTVYYHNPVKTVGTITDYRVTVVKNTSVYNLLGKKYPLSREKQVKKARGWHEQVIDLFR